jgi:hypothetical protein
MFVLCRWDLPLSRFLGAVGKQDHGVTKELPKRRPSRVTNPLGGAGLILTAALGLSACGGAGNTTTSSATSAPATTVTTTPTATVAKPSGEAQHSSSSSAPKKGAAGFRVTKGDNSIPDFGREAHPSERQRAVAALTTFLRARANGEWSKMCRYLARPNLRLLDGFARNPKGKSMDCGSVLAALQKKASSAERADPLISGLAALRIKGKSAFALFHGANNNKYVMPMQNEDGAWKMTQLAPLPYPLGTPAGTP